MTQYNYCGIVFVSRQYDLNKGDYTMGRISDMAREDLLEEMAGRFEAEDLEENYN